MPNQSYIEFYIELEVKNSSKGKRILLEIEKKIDQKLLIEELYKSGEKGLTVICYLELNDEESSKLIELSLLLIDKIGHKWIVKNPNLNHDEYWKFEGERNLTLGTFRVNGINFIKFSLTNQERKREGILLEKLN